MGWTRRGCSRTTRSCRCWRRTSASTTKSRRCVRSAASAPGLTRPHPRRDRLAHICAGRCTCRRGSAGPEHWRQCLPRRLRQSSLPRGSTAMLGPRRAAWSGLVCMGRGGCTHGVGRVLSRRSMARWLSGSSRISSRWSAVRRRIVLATTRLQRGVTCCNLLHCTATRRAFVRENWSPRHAATHRPGQAFASSAASA